MSADLPGLKKEDLKVEVTGNVLTIQGVRQGEHEQNEKGFYRSERRYGSFHRSIPLPQAADARRSSMMVCSM